MNTIKNTLKIISIINSNNSIYDFIIGVIFEFFIILTSVSGPLFLKYAVDVLTEGGSKAVLATALTLAFVASWSFTCIISVGKITYTGRICDNLTSYLLTKALSRRLRPMAAGQDDRASSLQGTFERLPYSLRTLVEGLLFRLLPLVTEIIVTTVIVAVVVGVAYSVIMLGLLVAYGLFSYRTSGAYEDESAKTNAAAYRLSMALSDLLGNMLRAVVNGQTASEIARVTSAADDRLGANVSMSRKLLHSAVRQYGLIGLGIVVILSVAIVGVAGGSITVGDFVLLQAYVLSFALPVSSYGFVLRQAGVSSANVSDAFHLAGIGETPKAGLYELRLSPAPLAVHVDDLSFSYGENSILAELSFAVEAGQTVAIVGPNGSGKSTLAKILAGLEVAQSGTISIAPENVLYVPQHLTFFPRSVAETGSYPPSRIAGADLETVLNELRFIEDDSVDLQSSVGDKGGSLSGGQRQKLEIARLTALEAPVIVMDEITSALDTISEQKALEILRRSRFGKSTMIFISHSESVATAADAVIFMRNGRMVASGSHRSLLETVPEYRSFWNCSAK